MPEHRIGEDIAELEVDVAHEMGGWIAAGIRDLESFLAPYAAFLDYLDTRPKE